MKFGRPTSACRLKSLNWGLISNESALSCRETGPPSRSDQLGVRRQSTLEDCRFLTNLDSQYLRTFLLFVRGAACVSALPSQLSPAWTSLALVGPSSSRHQHLHLSSSIIVTASTAANSLQAPSAPLRYSPSSVFPRTLRSRTMTVRVTVDGGNDASSAEAAAVG